jgi:hypothetical protein
MNQALYAHMNNKRKRKKKKKKKKSFLRVPSQVKTRENQVSQYDTQVSHNWLSCPT